MMMDITKYKTAGQWYKAMKQEGYQIPLALFYKLNILSEEKGISFQEAYQELSDKGRIKIVDKTISFDLNEKK